MTGGTAKKRPAKEASVDTPTLSANTRGRVGCRSRAHVRQSSSDSGVDCRLKSSKRFKVFPFRLQVGDYWERSGGGRASVVKTKSLRGRTDAGQKSRYRYLCPRHTSFKPTAYQKHAQSTTERVSSGHTRTVSEEATTAKKSRTFT